MKEERVRKLAWVNLVGISSLDKEEDPNLSDLRRRKRGKMKMQNLETEH